MSLDLDKTELCQWCWTKTLVTDRGAADIVCTACGIVWGKWCPQHVGDEGQAPERPAYERCNYFENVLDNTLGYDCQRFSANDLAQVRAVWPDTPPEEWDVSKVRAATRRLKMKKLTKSAGRMAHALRFGVDAPYPRVHHLQREAMAGMFGCVIGQFNRLKKRSRKNLISYAFIIGKLLEEVGLGKTFEHLVVPIKTKSKREFASRVWESTVAMCPWRNRIDRDDNVSVREYLTQSC